MKKVLVLATLLSSLYAVPPCKQDENVCILKTTNHLSRDITVVNMSDTPIIFKASGYISTIGSHVENVRLEPYKRYKIIEKFYLEYKELQRDPFFITYFSYKQDDEITPINIYKNKMIIRDSNKHKVKTTIKKIERIEKRVNNEYVSNNNHKKKLQHKYNFKNQRLRAG